MPLHVKTCRFGYRIWAYMGGLNQGVFMKITPIEIRQHTFEKGMRGYRTEEVDAFLASLSQEWERVTSEGKMLKMQLELAEKELNKLREVEMTLFRTLKNAEDTSIQITEQANRVAEQYMNDTRQKADDVLADARKRSALLVQDAENQARFLKDNILNDLKAIEHDFKAMERYKGNLIEQIKTLSSNALDSVERFEKKFAKQTLKGKIDEVVNQIISERDDDQAPANAAPDETPVAATETPVLPADAEVPESVDTHTEQVDLPTDPAPETNPRVTEWSVNGAGHDPHPSDSLVSDAIVEAETVTVDDKPKKEGGSFFDQI